MTASEIKECFSINPGNSEALVLEKLFCGALLGESTDVIRRVTKRYVEWRDTLRAAAQDKGIGNTADNKQSAQSIEPSTPCYHVWYEGHCVHCLKQAVPH